MNNKLKFPLPPIPEQWQSQRAIREAHFDWKDQAETIIRRAFPLDKITRPINYELLIHNKTPHLKDFPDRCRPVINLLMDKTVITQWQYLKRITYIQDDPTVTKYQLHLEWRTIASE